MTPGGPVKIKDPAGVPQPSARRSAPRLPGLAPAGRPAPGDPVSVGGAGPPDAGAAGPA